METSLCRQSCAKAMGVAGVVGAGGAKGAVETNISSANGFWSAIGSGPSGAGLG